MERLSEAERHGHEVLALVRASAINQDGASNGLTAPNGPSQERVIRQALAAAGLSPSQVDAVEAHGTGTALGDPIEAQALLSVYGRDRSPEHPLWLGSIKSNIGHAQAAAGVAGVIKMAMALREGLLPRTLHVDRPSSHVDWEAGAVSLLSEPRPWSPNGGPRRAGISSFGISGTNGHLILEEAPAREPVGAQAPEGDAVGIVKTVPWPLSARSPQALSDQAGRLAGQVRDADPDPLDVGYSLASGRAQMQFRALLVDGAGAGFMDGLRALRAGEPAPSLVTGQAAPPLSQGGPIFVFPGQGAQWSGMARELLQGSPLFAAEMARCEEALGEFIEWSVLEDLEREEELVLPARLQPVLFSVMVSLAALWRGCGVSPAAVVGHSQGEIAAACVAGALTLSDAAKVVALRSQVLERLAGKGGMVSLAASAAEAERLIAPFGERLCIAAHNGPRGSVVSGESEALGELIANCEGEGVRARQIVPGIGASHSPLIDELREETLELLAGIEPRSGEIPLFSTVRGQPIDTAEMDAAYWFENMRRPIAFEAVTKLALEQGHRAFVEVSPHPLLTMALQETAEQQDLEPLVVGTLRRGEGGLGRFLKSLGELWVGGGEVDWERVFAGSSARRMPLPTYPFQRERFWLQEDAEGSGDVRRAGLHSAEHPLLGAAVSLAEGDGMLLTGRLSLVSHPWLADHAVMGAALVPGTALLELALHAGEQIGCEEVGELVLETPLFLPEEGGVAVQVLVSEPDEEGRREVGVFSRPDSRDEELQAEWTRHASGLLAPATAAPAAVAPELWPPAGAEPVDVENLYDRLADFGGEYGPEFQGLQAAWRLDGEIFAEVELSEAQAERAGEFGIHPALLDSALHAAARRLHGQGGISRPPPHALRLERGALAPQRRLQAAGACRRAGVDFGLGLGFRLRRAGGVGGGDRLPGRPRGPPRAARCRPLQGRRGAALLTELVGGAGPAGPACRGHRGGGG